MINRPDNFPDKCPPDDSELPDGVFYHFIKGDCAKESDFICKVDKDPSFRDNCQAYGISLLKDPEDINNYRLSYRNIFGNQNVVEISLNNDMGLVKNTPTNSAKSHYTWWKPNQIKPWDFCKVLKEEI
jgi:hypothetical protein